jgi:acetyl/propionyl-CoA carboxylase alpha subunit
MKKVPYSAEIFEQATCRDVEEAVDAANRIIQCIMIKASEGGGGKGIRFVENEKRPPSCLHSSSERGDWKSHIFDAAL